MCWVTQSCVIWLVQSSTAGNLVQKIGVDHDLNLIWIHMFIHIYIYIYIHMYIYIYVYTYVNIYVYIYVCLQSYTCIHIIVTYVYTWTCVSIHVYIYVCIHNYIYRPPPVYAECPIEPWLWPIPAAAGCERGHLRFWVGIGVALPFLRRRLRISFVPGVEIIIVSSSCRWGA